MRIEPCGRGLLSAGGRDKEALLGNKQKWVLRNELKDFSLCFKCARLTWLICTADTGAAQTEEWLGELGSDLQGPIDSCCFFRVATIF